jgi:hypothetical protein
MAAALTTAARMQTIHGVWLQRLMFKVFSQATVHCVYHSVQAVLTLLSGNGGGGVDLITTARKIISAPPTRPFSLSHLHSFHPAHKVTNGLMELNKQKYRVFARDSRHDCKKQHSDQCSNMKTENAGSTGILCSVAGRRVRG